ncbi:MAG: hypothetical protein U1E05_16275 [Patescibacteria group bacterium]|nr:hypothetical protein [Patescibacteria group bacterium]
MIGLASLLATGCGDGTCAVHGTVRFDGQPLPEGVISFIPDDPARPPDAGAIREGQFALRAMPGRKQVAIRASRTARHANPNDPDGAYLREDYIPTRYNTATQLAVEIAADGDNEFVFELQAETSQPGGR